MKNRGNEIFFRCFKNAKCSIFNYSPCVLLLTNALWLGLWSFSQPVTKNNRDCSLKILEADECLGYESPLVDSNLTAEHGNKFAQLPQQAFNFSTEGMTQLWTETLRPFALEIHGKYQRDQTMLTVLDETLIWCFARAFKPRKLVEIGAGYSTIRFHEAFQLNSKYAPFITNHIAIEPFRSHIIEEIKELEVIPQKLQDVNLDIFRTLTAGDMLFIDSSHVLKPHGDTILEYLFILPTLKPGVIVHIHDIFLPYDYPKVWYDQKRTYTEQWLLAALLHGSNEWDILFAAHYMSENSGELFATDGIPPSGGSFWMRKK